MHQELLSDPAQRVAMALVAGSVHGSVAVAAVWLTCRLLGSRWPSLAATLWWLVTLKFVVTLLAPTAHVPLPILPSASPPGIHGAVTVTEEMLDVTSSTASNIVWTRPDGIAAAATAPGPSHAVVFAACVWALGVLWHLRRLLVARRRVQRIVARATPFRHDAWLYGRFARQVGLGRVPVILVSAEVCTPQGGRGP